MAEAGSARELRAEVRAFLAAERERGVFTPMSDSWLVAHSPEFSRTLGARGWLGMTWPLEYGGHARSAVERFVVVEELLAAGAPVAAHWMADRQIGPALLSHGTERQRAELLPRMARGELYFALGMSEPDSGSDLASVRTTARHEADGWHVSGSKIWTSWAHRSHYMMTLCRTSPLDTGARHAGLSQLIVDLAAPGVTVRPIEQLNGGRHFNEVFLDDVVVPDDMLLGAEGSGWHQVTAELAYERSGPERFLSTFPLYRELARPEVAEPGGDLALRTLGGTFGELWTMHHLSMGVAVGMDRGQVPEVPAAMAKDLGTQLEQQLIERVRRAGLPGDARLRAALDQAVAQGPGFTLRGGTTEILRSVVAKGVGL
jgi:hypothetical protein